ncbi:MAG: cold shock domain-containing protein [Bacteroidetes bacterium]|nr:cold shock domain-containing protein [Bacteroidota bacterium]
MIFDKIKAFFSGKESKGSEKKQYNGVVKRVTHSKGYGFIASPELEKQVFVHFSDVTGRIKPGTKVTFRVEDSEKGPRAVEVVVVK